MGIDRARHVFMCLIFVAAMPLAALEMTLARTGGPAIRPAASWLTLLGDMDSALAHGDLASASAARHKAHLAALGSRSWEGFLAVGDAALRLGDASGDHRAMEAEARRAYLSALTRARAERSLDGVLGATESFVRLGDHQAVEQGIRMARDLAGPDADSQARVTTLAGR